MANDPGVAPILSTPDTHILNDLDTAAGEESSSNLSERDFDVRFEISRTIQEIRDHQWRRVALQFPDEMLPDSVRVYQTLARGLKPGPRRRSQERLHDQPSKERGMGSDVVSQPLNEPVKLTILADSSYGSCCVDEIAAEHISADVVVHYGRACLSPTARLPVLHVFTKQDVDYVDVIASFKATFPDLETKIILTGDMPYAHHVESISGTLRDEGYQHLHSASIIHDPSSLVPNRTLPKELEEDPAGIQNWQLFHISQPPTSLLLTLSSRVSSIQIYPTTSSASSTNPKTTQASTTALLRRRYALITSLTTVPIWGILINTLSVKNYLKVVSQVQSLIRSARKKSYLFVVGKLNAAKVANFAEIGGWVVIGCWETSLIDSKDFYRPVITPFELALALQSDRERLWTGEWRADFGALLGMPGADNEIDSQKARQVEQDGENGEKGDCDSEEESAPPEFDLRTGRYVSGTRPMQPVNVSTSVGALPGTQTSSRVLTRRAKGDLTAVNGAPSPAAEFLRAKRTWQGLGSDFEQMDLGDQEEQGSAIEEGRSGVARGYTVGELDRH